jgi:hypothetical protein
MLMVELIIDSTFGLIADWFCFINMRRDYVKYFLESDWFSQEGHD